MMFFCLLATFTLLSPSTTAERGGGSPTRLSVAAAAYTHYTSVFVLIALFGWAFLAGPRVGSPCCSPTLGRSSCICRGCPSSSMTGTSRPPGHRAAPSTDVHQCEDRPRPMVDWPSAVRGQPVARDRRDLPDHGRSGGGRGWPLLRLRWATRPRGGGRGRRSCSSCCSRLRRPLARPRQLRRAQRLRPAEPDQLVARARSDGGGARHGRAYAASALGGRLLLLPGFAIGAVKTLDSDNQRPEYAAAARFIEHTGDPGAPVVEAPEPTPGPQTALEAALAPEGDALPPDRKVLTLGLPTPGPDSGR